MHLEVTWQAEADLESGIRAFIIERGGSKRGQVPRLSVGTSARLLFQRMSYHDTPVKPLSQMRFVDTLTKPGTQHTYRVITVNGQGLTSQPSAPSMSK